MKYLKLTFGIAFLLLCIIAFYDYSFNERISLLGFDSHPESSQPRRLPFVDIICAALPMLLGILFGSIYESLKKRDGKISVFKEVYETVKAARFFKALLVSPLIFVGVYTA